MLEEKIEIFIDKTIKSIDKSRITQSFVFLVNDLLEEYLLDLNKIRLNIISDNKTTNQGFYICYNSNDVLLTVNENQVKKAAKSKLSFKNLRKSLLFTILHELGHLYLDLKKYKTNKYKNLEECYEETNNEIKKLKEFFKNEILQSRLILEEIKADQFAYKNLSYFENLYDFDGILI